MNWFLDLFKSNKSVGNDLQEISVDNLKAYNGQFVLSPFEQSIFDGGKFAGGFGTTQLQTVDYWTLRARSSQLFNDNLYARGLIRRLITNEINTGLTPEACPDETVLGLPEDSLTDWTEDVEIRHNLWAKTPWACDSKHQDTFGSIQRTARREALIGGDVLVVLGISAQTRTPHVTLIRGESVATPMDYQIRTGHTLKHGVEFDTLKRQVAYHVTQDDGSSKRIPAYGERSGRRLAWLLYGTDKRLDDVRGQPLLAIILQSIKEIDRYRDSVQRKATLNSILAMYIKKTVDKAGTLPMTGGAVKRGSELTTEADGSARVFNTAKYTPGLILDELQQGEEPVGFHNQGVDSSFAEFEAAIIHGLAWANEVPAEILTLAFTKNYSASQAAINEFKIYLNRVWSEFGEQFCQPIYEEWLVNEALLGRIRAQSMLDAWRDPQKFYIFAAWTQADWYGSIKPSTDMKKQAQGSQLLIAEGWSTNAREARVTTGTKFSKNIKRLTRENELKAKMMRPLAEFQKEFGPQVKTATELSPEALSAMQDFADWVAEQADSDTA